ncbi:hypothetical protein F2K80_003202 [Vibrio fluvialis]|nr:hypothetical protein [Vibrio fluvialis]
MKYGIIASYQGLFRILFIAVIPFVFLEQNSDKIASEFSVFSSVIIILAQAPGVYFVRILNENISKVRYAISTLSINLFFALTLNLIYFKIFDEYFISLAFCCGLPIVIIHMMLRNLWIYKKQENKVIISDVLFSFLFIVAYMLARKYIHEVNYYIVLFTAFIYIVASWKNLRLIKEQVKATSSGLSNFCSGGIIMLLPYVLGKFDSSVVYVSMLFVSILSVLMLIPRIILLKKTKSTVLATNSCNGYRYLILQRKNMLKILSLSLSLSFLCYLIISSYLKLNDINNSLIWIAVSLYLLFSQMSLFDCNYIIYKGMVNTLLYANVTLLFSFFISSLMVYYMSFYGIVESSFASIVSIYFLAFLMMFRYFYIVKVIDEQRD